MASHSTAQFIKKQMERVWQDYPVSNPFHKATWRLKHHNMQHILDPSNFTLAGVLSEGGVERRWWPRDKASSYDERFPSKSL